MDMVHVVAVCERACVVVVYDGFLELVKRVLKYHVEDCSIFGIHLIEEEVRGKSEDVASKSWCVVGASKPVAVRWQSRNVFCEAPCTSFGTGQWAS